MTKFDIARLRLRSERLIGAPFRRAEEVVAWLGAVQAQDYGAAKWGVGQRVRNCVDSDVEAAYVSGKILRTHVMRPTWHFVAPEDIRWLLELTGPRVNAVSAYRYRQLELDDHVLRRGSSVIANALREGSELTRPELGQALEEAGISASGQRIAYIVMHAELDGLICSGTVRGKQHTYALLEERVPPAKALTRDEALAELTRRYFASHGPALAQDFAWWSGLTVADAKVGIEMAKPDLQREVVDKKTYLFAPSTASGRMKNPTVHLLPNYDEYFIAYRDYSASFDASLGTKSAVLYEVLSRHIIVLNGKVVGGWRRTVKGKEARIEARLLVSLDEGQIEALHAAAEGYGRFVGMAVAVDIETAP